MMAGIFVKLWEVVCLPFRPVGYFLSKRLDNQEADSCDIRGLLALLMQRRNK